MVRQDAHADGVELVEEFYESQEREACPGAPFTATSTSTPDLTNPQLHRPRFRFGHQAALPPQPALASRERPPRSRLSFARPFASAVKMHSTVHIDPKHMSHQNEQRHQQHRRRLMNAALFAVLLATLVFVAVDTVRWGDSDVLPFVFSPLHALPTPRSLPANLSLHFPSSPSSSSSSAQSTTSDGDGGEEIDLNVNDGMPPADLPATHPDAALLSALRGHTKITPRWPRTPRADVSTLRTYGPAYASIIVSHKLRVVYVPVFKVATTSIMWHIAYLEDNRILLDARARDDGTHKHLLHNLKSPAWLNHTVYDISNDQLTSILADPTFLKFGFVRNPYDRVISAYVDKIAHPSFRNREYQSQLRSLFGNSSADSPFNTSQKPTFSEFLHAVRDVLKEDRLSAAGRKSESNLSRRDVHWRPQNELLHSDLIHLDFVGHYHQLGNDSSRVLEWMYRHTDRRMPENDAAHLHASDPQLKSEIFKLLRGDDSLRNIVREMYADDFARFHFSAAIPDF